MAIRYEHQMSAGADRRTMVRTAVKRGFEILGLAYLFRLQEYLLGGAYDWRDLFRVDILNCIGASMIVVNSITAPRKGRAALGAHRRDCPGLHRAGTDRRAPPLPRLLPAPADGLPGR